MSWLDWKLRDVIAVGGGVGIFVGTILGGFALSDPIISALGVALKEDSGALTIAAPGGGIALGYIFGAQFSAGRRVRGLFSATIIVVLAIAGEAAVYIVGRMIENELLALLVTLPMFFALLMIVAGLSMAWAHHNPWVANRISGRNR